MIPKLSQPLTKSVRTLEGLLVLASNVALVVLPIVTALPVGQSVKYGTILNAAYAFARGLPKGLAALGVSAPAKSAPAAQAAPSPAPGLAQPNPMDIGPSAADLQPPPPAPAPTLPQG